MVTISGRDMLRLDALESLCGRYHLPTLKEMWQESLTSDSRRDPGTFRSWCLLGRVADRTCSEGKGGVHDYYNYFVSHNMFSPKCMITV